MEHDAFTWAPPPPPPPPDYEPPPPRRRVGRGRMLIVLTALTFGAGVGGFAIAQAATSAVTAAGNPAAADAVQAAAAPTATPAPSAHACPNMGGSHSSSTTTTSLGM